MKNKTIMLILFTIIKGAATAVALFLLFLFLQNSRYFIQQIKQYHRYSSLSGYYELHISPDISEDSETMQKLDDALVDFFLKTNDTENLESFLLSADSQIGLYDEGFITQDELEIQNYVITINESYLRKHPIYDTQGNPVKLSGNREENYLLVPEKYHLHEKELKTYYEENNTFLKYYIDDLKKMGIEAAHQQKHTIIPTNIIYISDGQSYQLPNMNPAGKYQCRLIDPLVNIVTNENVSTAQIPAYITNQDYLIKADTAESFTAIKQIISDTGLDVFLMEFVPVSQQHIHYLRLTLITLLLQLVLIIILRGILCLLEKHRIKQISTKLRITALLVSWGLALGFFPVLHLPFNAASLLTIVIIFFMDIYRYRIFVSTAK